MFLVKINVGTHLTDTLHRHTARHEYLRQNKRLQVYLVFGGGVVYDEDPVPNPGLHSVALDFRYVWRAAWKAWDTCVDREAQGAEKGGGSS